MLRSRQTVLAATQSSVEGPVDAVAPDVAARKCTQHGRSSECARRRPRHITALGGSAEHVLSLAATILCKLSDVRRGALTPFTGQDIYSHTCSAARQQACLAASRAQRRKAGRGHGQTGRRERERTGREEVQRPANSKVLKRGIQLFVCADG